MGRARVPARHEDVPPPLDVIYLLDLPTRAALRITDREDAIPPQAAQRATKRSRETFLQYGRSLRFYRFASINRNQKEITYV